MPFTLYVAAVSTESASGSVYKVVVMPPDKVSEIRDKAVEAFVELGWSEEVLERLNICIWRAGGWEPMHGNRTLGSYRIRALHMLMMTDTTTDDIHY